MEHKWDTVCVLAAAAGVIVYVKGKRRGKKA
jgi:hypothetical protein